MQPTLAFYDFSNHKVLRFQKWISTVNFVYCTNAGNAWPVISHFCIPICQIFVCVFSCCIKNQYAGMSLMVIWRMHWLKLFLSGSVPEIWKDNKINLENERAAFFFDRAVGKSESTGSGANSQIVVQDHLILKEKVLLLLLQKYGGWRQIATVRDYLVIYKDNQPNYLVSGQKIMIRKSQQEFCCHLHPPCWRSLYKYQSKPNKIFNFARILIVKTRWQLNSKFQRKSLVDGICNFGFNLPINTFSELTEVLCRNKFKA